MPKEKAITSEDRVRAAEARTDLRKQGLGDCIMPRGREHFSHNPESASPRVVAGGRTTPRYPSYWW